MMSCQTLGFTQQHEVKEYVLKNDVIEVHALNYGATISAIYTPDRHGNYENVVCAFEDPMDFIDDHDLYLNKIVGPVAGRIAFGKYPYGSLKPFPSKHHLHGGEHGISFQWFEVQTQVPDTLIFSLETHHQADGYPGNFHYRIIYRLEKNQLIMEMEAISDHDNLLNLTSHLYFNLSGDLKRDIMQHQLCIPSQKVLDIHPDGYPYRIISIPKHSGLDFMEGRIIQDGYREDDPFFQYTHGLDHPFLLASKPITLYDPISGRHLTMTTDRQALVAYAANYFNEHHHFEHHIVGRPHLAIALEPQECPNGINIEEVEDKAYYLANTPYHAKTTYTFDVQ